MNLRKSAFHDTLLDPTSGLIPCLLWPQTMLALMPNITEDFVKGRIKIRRKDTNVFAEAREGLGSFMKRGVSGVSAVSENADFADTSADEHGFF